MQPKRPDQAQRLGGKKESKGVGEVTYIATPHIFHKDPVSTIRKYIYFLMLGVESWRFNSAGETSLKSWIPGHLNLEQIWNLEYIYPIVYVNTRGNCGFLGVQPQLWWQAICIGLGSSSPRGVRRHISGWKRKCEGKAYSWTTWSARLLASVVFFSLISPALWSLS